jgi:Fe/S biogenesis protein NfuA
VSIDVPEDLRTEPVITVTDDALAQILELKAKETDGDELCLRIEVVGTQGVDYLYDLAFATLDEAVEGDSVATTGDLPVIVPAASVSKLMGATLDLPSGDQAGLVLRNPNRPNPLAGEEVDLSGTTEEKINQLLEQSINPALASHGGYAVLQRVEERDEGVAAVVTMGGGCQGCAVSAITLREGIEAAIKEAIPEVVEIIDGTDHDAGENPYFT